MRRINELGLNLIKSFEKCKLDAYQDQGGLWTIGWGHLLDKGDKTRKWTQKEADEMLQKDLEKFEKICDYVKVPVTDNQFSALVCIAFNIGMMGFKNSQLLRKLNNNEDPTTAWMNWRFVNGIESKGLVRRRNAEIDLWRKDDT